jgi:hypothetical protein
MAGLTPEAIATAARAVLSAKPPAGTTAAFATTGSLG